MNPERRRRAAEARGRRAETLAALWLGLKLYRVLDRRVRTPRGELDLVARRGGLLVFIEVKQRPSGREAVEAVTPRQQARIAAAAEVWAARRGLDRLDRRFDVITVSPGRLPHHMRDAFRPDFALTRG